MAIKGFTGTQKRYLEGLASGLRLAQKAPRSSCHHACAQHGVADIGLLAMRAPLGTSGTEHYQLWLGGQVAEGGHFGREYASNVPASDVSRVVEEVVDVYLESRRPDDTFRQFVSRVPAPELQRWTRERQENRAGGLR